MKKHLLLLTLLASYQLLLAQVSILSEKENKTDFKLVYNNITANLIVSESDFEVVRIATSHLQKDIEVVSGQSPKILNSPESNKPNVIIGTIGFSKFIDDLISSEKINIDNVKGNWETFSIQVVNNDLIIVGSDRRGTAFGVYELSKQIGVSPWYWWADVPINKKQNILIKQSANVWGPPSVKYRGIFINDEDWGLKPWASKNFDPELKDIGPKTYEKVFELLLRLKANYLWPAMHECTKAFNQYPENKVLADKYSIVMGSAHCEPLLFNNATEWDKKTMGEWRYDTNREGVYNVLDKRVSENGKFENVYTVGMRGIHDQGMMDDIPLEKQITLLEEAINDQREILEKHTGKKAKDIPQVFIPYKEVMTLYNNGLNVPDDVTLMWVDDNYGYIRRLSDPNERKRSGGSGVYYHVSYLGQPHEYLWLGTTPPALIWEEMKKAYEYNAQEVWVVNVGDIKACEYDMEFFLDLAWDVDIVQPNNINSHLRAWLAQQFSGIDIDETSNVINEFNQLCYERKPEHMGFGKQQSWGKIDTDLNDTEFSFLNYREAEKRISRYNSISNKIKLVYDQIDEKQKPAFFQLVYYPIVASNYMNQKLLLAQKNRMYSKQRRNLTNTIASEVWAYYDSLQNITKEYNELLNGKWKYMMSIEQHNFSKYYEIPPLDSISIPDKAEMGVMVEENDVLTTTTGFQQLPCFNSLFDEKYFFEVFNKGINTLSWKAKSANDWIVLSKKEGGFKFQERVFVSIDWDKLKNVGMSKGIIEIISDSNTEQILVSAFKPVINKKEVEGLYVEKNGYISINAENYHRKITEKKMDFITINNLGQTGNLVAPFPFKIDASHPYYENAPRLEYDIYCFNSGNFEIQSRVLPVFPINSFRGAYYGIAIDDEEPQKVNVFFQELSAQWMDNVLGNVSINTTKHYVKEHGKHTVKIYMIDAGMAYDKLILNFGGLKSSYLGPNETKY